MAEHPDPSELRKQLESSWTTYLDLLAPLRPEIFKFCRRLTRSAWDAEDLVQDVLLRGFGHLGHLGHEVGNLRAYMMRTASNVWIDHERRRINEARILAECPPKPAPAPDAYEHAEMRDAGWKILRDLSPQESAAVVLKDVFELSLREIAEVLGTSEGAIKHALHRGRGRLQEPESAPERPEPSTTMVDRFIELYDAQDVAGLVALLQEGGAAENVGFGVQYGSRVFGGTEHFLHKIVHGHEDWPEWARPESIRLDKATYYGAALILQLATRGGVEALEFMVRVDECDGKISRLRSYGFCPETMREVGAALGLEVRTGLYRPPDQDMALPESLSSAR